MNSSTINKDSIEDHLDVLGRAFANEAVTCRDAAAATLLKAISSACESAALEITARRKAFEEAVHASLVGG